MFELVEYSFENFLYIYTQFVESGMSEDALLGATALTYLPFIMAIGCVFEVVKAFFSFCCSMCKSRGRD